MKPQILLGADRNSTGVGTGGPSSKSRVSFMTSDYILKKMIGKSPMGLRGGPQRPDSSSLFSTVADCRDAWSFPGCPSASPILLSLHVNSIYGRAEGLADLISKSIDFCPFCSVVVKSN
jgi:hypothetical protein